MGGVLSLEFWHMLECTRDTKAAILMKVGGSYLYIQVVIQHQHTAIMMTGTIYCNTSLQEKIWNASKGRDIDTSN